MAANIGKGLVDLHCHILPGVDDGPATDEVALQLVQGVESLGFTELYPTPHQKQGFWTPGNEECVRSARHLQALLEKNGSSARIHPPAAENMWDDLFFTRRADGAFPAYPGGKAFLLELPTDLLPPGLQQQLFELRIEGRLPVLAHVERYPSLAKDRARMEAIARSAALLVNLSALGGGDGFWTQRTARRLVRERLVHAVATDCHGPDDLPHLEAGLGWLRSHDEQGLQTLLLTNPEKILAGELPEW
jgi:protein-tyrosine phosphatase